MAGRRWLVGALVGVLAFVLMARGRDDNDAVVNDRADADGASAGVVGAADSSAEQDDRDSRRDHHDKQKDRKDQEASKQIRDQIGVHLLVFTPARVGPDRT